MLDHPKITVLHLPTLHNQNILVGLISRRPSILNHPYDVHSFQYLPENNMLAV